jgi:2-keto-4-pentenoate hydratase/2-oxohepta-3-ene-1,7-dioic acid hydratase in catechol pathway
MKLVTFRTAAGASHIGAMTGDLEAVVDLTAADTAPAFASMLALIDAGPEALDRARSLIAAGMPEIPLDQVKLLAPLPEPRQMRDCLVFEKHLMQAREQSFRRQNARVSDLEAKVEAARSEGRFKPAPVWYQQPIYYKCNRFSVIGPGEDILWPRYAELIDYELEFGIVIGRKGKDITREKAREHIFGYTIFNDISARDAQAAEMAGMLGPAKGKDFDTGNVLGPWLVTADEIADPYNLTMVARVNGQEWSRGNSGTMHHKFEDIIAHVSMSETLYPGEFLGSGTVGGGCGLEQGRYLKNGDVIELEVTGLGVLRNRIVRT